MQSKIRASSGLRQCFVHSRVIVPEGLWGNKGKETLLQLMNICTLI